MQYTNHYNLNLPEGTDVVNPLVQDNPNYTAIDNALYANKVRVVGNATEVKSGTVHAITRSDSDIDVIRFTATGNWDAGDTMTVDGTPVSVYLPDGTAPLTGAYVINTEVMAAINGSRVTLYTGGISSLDAIDVDYNNASSGLNAANAQAAIDELAGKTVKTLWTNPSPSASFPTQSMSLSSNDYDLLICVAVANINASDLINITGIAAKGYGMEVAYITSGTTRFRRFIRVNDTTYTAEGGFAGSDADNASGVPLAIYGIKF